MLLLSKMHMICAPLFFSCSIDTNFVTQLPHIPPMKGNIFLYLSIFEHCFRFIVLQASNSIQYPFYDVHLYYIDVARNSDLKRVETHAMKNVSAEFHYCEFLYHLFLLSLTPARSLSLSTLTFALSPRIHTAFNCVWLNCTRIYILPFFVFVEIAFDLRTAFNFVHDR